MHDANSVLLTPEHLAHLNGAVARATVLQTGDDCVSLDETRKVMKLYFAEVVERRRDGSMFQRQLIFRFQTGVVSVQLPEFSYPEATGPVGPTTPPAPNAPAQVALAA